MEALAGWGPSKKEMLLLFKYRSPRRGQGALRHKEWSGSWFPAPPAQASFCGRRRASAAFPAGSLALHGGGRRAICHPCGHQVRFSLGEAAMFTQQPAPPPRLRPWLHLQPWTQDDPFHRACLPLPALCCFLCFHCKRKKRIQMAQEKVDWKGKDPFPYLASFPPPRGYHCYCFWWIDHTPEIWQF